MNPCRRGVRGGPEGCQNAIRRGKNAECQTRSVVTVDAISLNVHTVALNVHTIALNNHPVALNVHTIEVRDGRRRS
eukprot:3666510-Pyramimonas_sp.AAC.1